MANGGIRREVAGWWRDVSLHVGMLWITLCITLVSTQESALIVTESLDYWRYNVGIVPWLSGCLFVWRGAVDKSWKSGGFPAMRRVVCPIHGGMSFMSGGNIVDRVWKMS